MQRGCGRARISSLQELEERLGLVGACEEGVTVHTELALDPAVCSFCEGVTLRFIVLRVSTLARKDTESASASTLRWRGRWCCGWARVFSMLLGPRLSGG